MSEYQVIAPLFFNSKHSEAECLGIATWLWMHSENHKYTPIYALPTLILPAIKRQQFILIIKDNKPVCYMSWANMSEETEQKYLQDKSALSLTESDWYSGTRMWAIDWISPFGETQKLASFVLKDILPDFCFRALSHQGKKRGFQIKFFKGKHVSKVQAQQWQINNPLIINN
ncbi:toxin-activating lysine-acyltransferase [Zophobihabitans entericus]|uniref:RTX toxin-activating lysine-acyltransferase n=1 Tax=Zophobihabitans entericus TaxID=1635327 RepID=A0A6G9ICT5_9GAMM|nr:toxin-activating lysine-acyltransferase [Zophobihabitans entericus]QIQ22033.1 toxin-activating lysine-acyltransferase [Zophobihabitans entericus]